MRRKVLLITMAVAAVLGGSGAAQAAFCPVDLDGDGSVGFSDLTALLGLWGPCGAGPCPADLDGDQIVGFSDLTALLGSWGTCGSPEIRTIDLAGLPLEGYPHFTPYALFTTEQTAHIGVDPGVVPDLIGRPLDAYVVTARTAAEWRLDPTLTDVRGAPQTIVLPGPGLSGSIVAIEGALPGNGGLGFGVAYDLVLDVDRDGALSGGDVIDGAGDEAGFTVVGDLTAPGPLTVAWGDYNGGPFLFQRTYYPASIGAMNPLPLIVISHGNGMQYTWYDYLGFHLASHGYVVMAHSNDTMPGIHTAAATTLTNTEYILGAQASILGGALDGHLDASRIVWIGHSRGGEGVVRAYDYVRDGTYDPVYFELESIALISSIAPVSWLTTADSSPGQVRYHLLYGAADGDVFGGVGVPEEPPGLQAWAVQPYRVFERATSWRCTTYVHGADHSDFNTDGPWDDFCWDWFGPCAPELAIGRPEAQNVAKATYLALLKHVLDGHDAARELLWRQHENLQAPGVAAETIINHEFRDFAASAFVIDDFQTQSSLATSSSGGVVVGDVLGSYEGRFADANTSFTWLPGDPMNGMTRASALDDPRGLVFEYAADAFIEFEVVSPQRDWTSAHALSLRACQGSRHPNTVAENGDLDFSITLRDGAGVSSTIRIGVYGGGLEEPFERTGQGTGSGWANEFETIRLRVRDFVAEGSGLDLSNVVAVRLEFGPSFGSAIGRICIDDLEITAEVETR